MAKTICNIALNNAEVLRKEADEAGVALTPYINQVLSKRDQAKKIDEILARIQDLDSRIERLELAILSRGLNSKAD